MSTAPSTGPWSGRARSRSSPSTSPATSASCDASDAGAHEGRHYIVMEYAEGRSGAQILQKQGPLDPETAAEAGTQACAGLDYAHPGGVLHRDVKPGNL